MGPALSAAEIIVVTKPWDHPDPESDRQCIGPIDVPWSARKWIFDTEDGSFRLTVQDFRLEKKTLKLLDMGFRDKHIVSSGKNATHSSGAPVVSKDVVEAVFDLATETDTTIAEAYIAFNTKAKVRLHPEFEEKLQQSPKRYTQQTADKLKATLVGENDDEAIRRLEVELQMRKDAAAKKTPGRRRIPAQN